QDVHLLNSLGVAGWDDQAPVGKLAKGAAVPAEDREGVNAEAGGLAERPEQVLRAPAGADPHEEVIGAGEGLDLALEDHLEPGVENRAGEKAGRVVDRGSCLGKTGVDEAQEPAVVVTAPPSRQDLLIERSNRVGDALPAEQVPGPSGAPPAQERQQLRVLEEMGKALGKSLGLLGGHQVSGLAVSDRELDPLDLAAD